MSASALLRLTVCVVAAATLTACGVTDAQPVASEPSDGETGTYSSYADVTYLVECVSDELRNRPESFVLSCADGNSSLQDLHWKRWGDTSATAEGTFTTNPCEPDCASSKPVQQHVNVTATALSRGEAGQAYTKLEVVAIDSVEGGITKETFKLPGLAKAQAE